MPIAITYPLRYTRRRYGRTTYTWVEAQIGDEWVKLGDPWPCITPPRREIAQAIELAIQARHDAH